MLQKINYLMLRAGSSRDDVYLLFIPLFLLILIYRAYKLSEWLKTKLNKGNELQQTIKTDEHISHA